MNCDKPRSHAGIFYTKLSIIKKQYASPCQSGQEQSCETNTALMNATEGPLVPSSCTSPLNQLLKEDQWLLQKQRELKHLSQIWHTETWGITTRAYLISHKMIPRPVLFTATDSDSNSWSVLGKGVGEGECGRETEWERWPNFKQYTVHASLITQISAVHHTLGGQTLDKGFRYRDLLWGAWATLP